jgi:hypothetical protein
MEFVYSNNHGLVAWGPGSSIMMTRNEVWYADDPFVLARPDLFSTTPVIVHSTIGKDSPAPTPVETGKRRKAGARG